MIKTNEVLRRERAARQINKLLAKAQQEQKQAQITHGDECFTVGSLSALMRLSSKIKAIQL